MTEKSNQHSSNGIKHLKFNLEKENMNLAYKFLSLLDNSCSSFIADLICSYLKSQGINDISRLSKEDAKKIARSAGNTSADPSNYTIFNLLMSSLLQANQSIGNPAYLQAMAMSSSNIEVKGEVPPVEPSEKKSKKAVPVPTLTETENFPFSEIDNSTANISGFQENIDSDNEYIDDSLLSGMSDLYN